MKPDLKYRFQFKTQIPKERLDDVIELQKFIQEKLHVEITRADTYRLWRSISESWSASWLYIDTHYEGVTREEFLWDEMTERGCLSEVI